VLEIEMKFRADDWSALETQLLVWNAEVQPERIQTDHYFNAADRDFAQTDEAVRLRRSGATNTLTYKGKKIDTETKTRREIEVPLADGDDTAANVVAFLTSLGMKPVAVISKTRRAYHFSRNGFDVAVCLDDAGPVGKFVELEILAEEDRFPAAKALLMQLAQELGLTQQERRSYLRMNLER